MIDILLVIVLPLFAIVIAETVFCVVAAMKFRVEQLSGFRERFTEYYGISVERKTVSWEESKHNWFLWLSVFTGNIKTSYSPLRSFLFESEAEGGAIAIEDNIRILGFNAVCIANNVKSYTIIVLSVPFYLIFSVCSYIERVFRLALDPIMFSCFFLLAKLKILYIYYFEGKTLVVGSVKADVTCSSDVIYRKPVIRILLCNPQKCSDSTQKDNINHFTTTLKSVLPSQQYIKFKTEVVYPEDENILQTELPMTLKYLCVTYAKLTHIKSEEVSQ
jgi:hypothetical protein